MCALLDESEYLEDPWDMLDEAAPAYRAKMGAADSLKRIPGQPDTGSQCIRHCPECGRLFFWHHGFSYFGDHDYLELHKFSPEMDSLLRPVIEAADEKAGAAAFFEVWKTDDEAVREGARKVFALLLYWKYWKSKNIRLLSALAMHPSAAARSFALDALAGLLRNYPEYADEVRAIFGACDSTSAPLDVQAFLGRLRSDGSPDRDGVK